LENLSFSYPAWFLFLCLLAGLLFALILYFRDKKFKEVSGFLLIGLSLLRFLGVSAICLLLLSPLLKSAKTQIQNPIVVFAQDMSQSVVNQLDSTELTNYNTQIAELKTSLAEKFELKSLAFGEKVRPFSDTMNYVDKVSNLSGLFQYIEDQYSTQNLGSVVIATDGIYNEGRNPLYSNFRFKTPVHLIAMGDTTPRKDLNIKRIYNNNIAYLNDKFGIQVDVEAINAAGARSIIKIFRKEDGRFKKIEEKGIRINSDDFFESHEFILEAKQSGINQYRISLNSITGEISTSNNVKDIYIEVLDARQKILVLAHAAHPDLAAINKILSQNQNNELSIEFIQDFKGNPLDFDLVIFHNLPSRKFNIQDILTQINKKKTPRLFVVGSNVRLDAFNEAQNVLSIQGTGGVHNETQAIVQENFNAFTIGDELKNRLVTYPPVQAPFGDYTLGPKTIVLLSQKISGIETEYPLFAFADIDEIKTGVFAAEGIWKWRLYNFLENENIEIISELLGKGVQYVSIKEDKRKFRVKPDKTLFKENERIQFSAELYNNSYERINEPDVFLQIYNEEGEEFPYTFSKKSGFYALDAGLFPSGNYRFKANVNFNGLALKQNGQFSIQSIQLEMYDLTARHDLINNLANKYNQGTVYYANQVPQLQEDLLNNDQILPVVYQRSQTKPIINLKWIFGLLILLFGLEWFLRRFHGGY
jgi:hypothetical protein